MNVAAFESLAASRNIDLSCEIDEQLNLAFFDSDSVQKILNNLLSNALKFTPAGGMVRVQALKENEFLVLSVEDNGKGIPSDQLTHIFDRFHQVDSSEAYGGTGIGLTLTKELVSLHHGTISAKSTAEKGSRFDIQIPISARAYHQAEMAEQEQETPTTFHDTTMPEPVEEVELNNKKAIALIVEDNLDLIHHITSILQAEYKVVQAHNGKEGMAKAVDLIPDILISDWMMPEMDGLELCKLLRHDERTSHIPIVMLTAKVDIESKLDGLKTGADEYLAKPFNTDELLIRMQNLINQREQLRLKYNKTIALSPSKVDVDNPDERFLLKTLSIVEEHISDTDLTVEKLQKELGVSRMQLHRKLKALTSFSTSEFIRDIRLQRAADLLKANGIQVTEAAYQSGFNSLSYFTQCFKNKYGIAPSDYHKNQA
jgi:DNA-binding response OmpR family regulator